MINGKVRLLYTRSQNFVQVYNFGEVDILIHFIYSFFFVFVQMLMYRLSAPADKAPYEAAVRTFLNSWLRGGDVTYTPGGLAWRDEWGALRYSGKC